MDNNERNSDDDCSSFTSNYTESSSDVISSKTTSLIRREHLNNTDNNKLLKIQTQSMHEKYEENDCSISSHSTTTYSSTSVSTTTTTSSKQNQEDLAREARPLGICVRRCLECRRLKHILLVECAACYRTMDLDINDCKCQILTNKSIIEYFTCSICNSALTLNGYVICANRTCQTTLSALTKNESLTEVQEKSIQSSTVTNIYDPRMAHKTVAIQVNTLPYVMTLQQMIPMPMNTKYEELSSLWQSKRDLNSTVAKSFDRSYTYCMSFTADQNLFLDTIGNNLSNAFNSNRPTKPLIRSGKISQQNLPSSAKSNDTAANSSREFSEVPRSPQCLAMISVPKRTQRPSPVLIKKKDKQCQTHMSCSMNTNDELLPNEILDVVVVRTNKPNQNERQLQVDTIKERFSGICQTYVEVGDRVEQDVSRVLPNDETMLQALTDRDGQKWTQLVDKLIGESSDLPSNEIGQQLLQNVEFLDNSGRLNDLTKGQLQRKILQVTSRINTPIKNDAKTTENESSLSNSLTDTKCKDKIDVLVTVRKLDKHHHCQSLVPPDPHWNPHVDRLFDRGHKTDEIQQAPQKAIYSTIQIDDRRLQDVYNYTNEKDMQPQKSTNTIQSIRTTVLIPTDVKSAIHNDLYTANVIEVMKSHKTIKNPSQVSMWILPAVSTASELVTKQFSPSFNNHDQHSPYEEKNIETISLNNRVQSTLNKLPRMVPRDLITAQSFVRSSATVKEPNGTLKKPTMLTASQLVTFDSSQNESLTSSNSPKKIVDTSKKQSKNDSSQTDSILVDDTDHESDAWTGIQEDINPIFSTNKHKEKVNQNQIRPFKISNKTNKINDSKFASFNSKASAEHQTDTIDSSTLPITEHSKKVHHLKKCSIDVVRRPFIRYPVTQIEKFDCGTIGPHIHSPPIARRLFNLSPTRDPQNLFSNIYQLTESRSDRLYPYMSMESNEDERAFESILNWQQQQESMVKIENSKCQQVYVVDPTTTSTIRGKQYPIIADEIDLIDDPNSCTIMNKWAFADFVNSEREKFIEKSKAEIPKAKLTTKLNNRFKICLRKRPLTEFEQHVFKEVDIVSVVDSQTLVLHIPSITVDSQVFVKHRKFKCDLAFDEHCQLSSIYHATLAPLLDLAVDNKNCLCLIGGGKYSGKNYLLQSLIDLFAFDLFHLVSTYDIYVKLLGICHNRVIDLLKNYSPIRVIKSTKSTLFPNDEYCLKTHQDIDYIINEIKKRRRFIHQLIQMNIHDKNQSTQMGSLLIVVLASPQYIYTQNLCSHRRKFLINSLNRTILSFKRGLLDFRKNSPRVRTAFNSDVLTRIIQPYVFHEQSHVYFIGTINPGHRHRTATKSTIDFARNLRVCLKRFSRKRRQKQK